MVVEQVECFFTAVFVAVVFYLAYEGALSVRPRIKAYIDSVRKERNRDSNESPEKASSPPPN